MCGIAGIFDIRGPSEIDRGVLERMTNILYHRGPDDAGLYVEPGVGLGFRRLAIIDLSDAGHQPMLSADGNIVVIFNGEIYNFQEIKKVLKDRGYSFRSHSDTEVILYAWQEWGEKCVDYFRGMFAIALWDKRSETLFLARDRLGKKPLYYGFLADGRLIFGSELKALLQYPGIPRDIDVCAVEDYFAYGYVPDPKTIYKNIHKLPPAHLLKIRRGEPVGAPEAYWDINFREFSSASQDELQEELIERLRESVRLRMIADVPLGSFLSGGVDSSGIVALMAGLTGESINTCSISFDQQDHDESEYAAMVAEQYKTNHHVKKVDPDDFDLVDRLASVYDEPFADSSAMPTYRVCQLARERVTVALSGDGGDEVFAGYRRYRWHHYEERVRGCLPYGLRKPVFGFLGRAYPKLDWAPQPLRAKTTFQALARSSEEAYFHSVSVLGDDFRKALFSEKMHSDLQGYRASDLLKEIMEKAPADDPLSKVQYADIKTYLPGDILTKVDRASMANSLEVRVPLLDHQFVGWAGGIPPEMRLHGSEGKYIFKKSLESYLPDSILYRDKMGFAVPIGSWFRGPLRERIQTALKSPILGDTGMFDMAYLERLASQHQSGVHNHSSALWALLMFESSLRLAEGEPFTRSGGLLKTAGI